MMVIVKIRKVMMLTLVLCALVLIPNASHAALASPIHPTAIYEPAMSEPSNSTPHMPLPTPAPGYIPQPAPISGVLRILIIAAAFSDVNETVSTATIRSEYFGQTPSVSSYYQEDSYGKVTLTGDVIGWYKLPYPESHYGMDCTGIDDPACDGQDASWQIAQDAYNLACKDVNFANYNYFVFVHSGNGEESSGVKNNVWSVTYLGGVWVRPTPNACSNDITLTKFNIVPELEAGGAVPIGVYCHEFGHQLGLPDLYNTNTGQTILGPWSLMDKGLWNGNPPGSSPSHMDAWSKIQLQFMSGSMIATANTGVTSSFTIDPTEVSSSNVHVVEVPLGSGSNPSKYYLIEVRSATGYDSALPSTGVLILYVDTSQITGKVKIINGHASVSNLADATWKVGQTFTDTANNWSVTITGQTGNSYQVSINRGPGQPPQIQQPQNQTYIDLEIASVSAQPQVITLPNTTVTITIQISNLGTQGVSNVPVEVDLDTQLYTNLQVSVGAAGTTPINFTWVSTLGSHTFKITIDPNNTINDTNRANNVATFTLSVGPALTVGPTLTINVPLNVTITENVWVLINGLKYNVTSSQFQTSVPNGTITVQIQPSLNTSQGVRQAFAGWSDGNLSNPRQLTVSGNMTIQAVYATQYLLSVNSNGGVTTPSGWYEPNSTVTVSAANPSNVTANSSRFLFSSWSGDLSSNSATLTVTMSKPVMLQANWVKQYYVTIISPAGSPSGEGWYNAESVATVGVQSTVQYSNGTRLVFNGWNSPTLGGNPTTQVTVNSPISVLAVWKTQYLITAQSEYGTASGGGWYDAGAPVQLSIQPEVDYGNQTRRIFTGWTGDASSANPTLTLTANGPVNVVAGWITQYEVTFQVAGLPASTSLTLTINNQTYPLTPTQPYTAWYNQGQTLTPTVTKTVLTVFQFTNWHNSAGTTITLPITVTAPAEYTATYTFAFPLTTNPTNP